MLHRRAWIVAGMLVAVLRPVPAQAGVFMWMDEPEAYRRSATCVVLACVGPPTPQNTQVLPDPACVAGIAAQPSPAGWCQVRIVGHVDGFSARNARVAVTYSLTHTDGAPWNDPVRKSLRAQEVLGQPVADPAPAVCDVALPADGVSCARTGPRTWTFGRTVRANGAAFSASFAIGFPAAGINPSCETFRIRGTARTGTQRASADLGAVSLCA